jgi:hypothetical protein
MKNKFLQISLGISIMLFAAGFFIRSVSTANAAPPKPGAFLKTGMDQMGPYQMAMVINPAGGAYLNLVVWNTQTGKSTIYYGQPKWDDDTKWLWTNGPQLQ